MPSLLKICVLKSYPMVPGIDLSTVVESDDPTIEKVKKLLLLAMI